MTIRRLAGVTLGVSTLLALSFGLGEVAAAKTAAPTEAWYEFKFHGKKVGFMHALDEGTTFEGVAALHAHRRSVVTVRRQAHVIRMEAVTDSWSTPDGQPLRFTHVRTEGGASRTIKGFRDGDSFDVRFEVGGQLTEKRVSAGKGVYLSSAIDGLFKRDLKVGKSMKGKVIVEEDGELRDFSVKVVRREGKHWVLESNVGQVMSIEHVADDGTTLRTHVVRMGAEFVKVDRAQALKLERTEDIFTAARLATGVRLPPGDMLDELKIRLVGKSGGPPAPIDDARQKLKTLKKGGLELRVRVGAVPKRGPKLPVRDKKMQKFLVETPYEAISDERVSTTARSIVGDTTDAWVAAKAINGFVYKHIANKSLAKAFSTANEALESKEGDCTEHAVLFSALAKAVGIPTRLVTGLVYVGGGDGLFGYHQWVEVWMGKGWVAMDPTFGQDVADPTHIKFTQGLSDADGLRDAGIAAAELFGDITLSVVEYLTVDGKRTRI